MSTVTFISHHIGELHKGDILRTVGIETRWWRLLPSRIKWFFRHIDIRCFCHTCLDIASSPYGSEQHLRGHRAMLAKCNYKEPLVTTDFRLFNRYTFAACYNTLRPDRTTKYKVVNVDSTTQMTIKKPKWW